MLSIPGRSTPLAVAIFMFAFAACTQSTIDRLEGSGATVEAPPVQPAITAEPIAPIIGTPVLGAAPLSPELVYFEPLPLPATHVLTALPSPSSTRKLNDVQSIEVAVEVAGGALGTREIAVVFVSPQGMVWQRQATSIEGTGQGTTIAHFSLPVASTFIEEQQLSGTWQINSLDDGLELASTTFVLEE